MPKVCKRCDFQIQECPSFENTIERYCGCQNDWDVNFDETLWVDDAVKSSPLSVFPKLMPKPGK